MDSSQQFSLRWNNYTKHITCAFDTLRSDEDLVDVTLSCEGKRIRAHKMLLSACSTYFRDLFKENPCQHPVIIFRNVKFDDLSALVDFMYQGEVNVVQEQLGSFLTTAELLAVQGLTDGTGKDNDSINEEETEIPNEPEVQLKNSSGKYLSNNKNNKSPSSPLPYHAVDVQPETPPPKRRKYRDTSNHENNKINTTKTSKELREKLNEQSNQPDPIEIIPLMPNLKLEMPEYLEADGSSCSYDEQNIVDGTLNKLDDVLSNVDDDKKPDISQTFYTNQSSSDTVEPKNALSTTDLDHLLAKPSTSSERVTQEPTSEIKIVATTTLESTTPPPTTTTTTTTTSVNERRRRTGANEEGRWICNVCGKIYTRGDSLAHHRSIHRGDTICPICQAVFTRKYTMRCHMVNIHGIK
ncbi:protein abrupt-like isoform X3 [Aphidius gifuensis]|uniref:protein abrupt-like isoform X3 n=1 Tax=Aphidius gifuensis TaxID=684658 RepID=UPI001CDB64E6|nr:protein abrupt-like isoform X3 [Aphidius gifuensis]